MTSLQDAACTASRHGTITAVVDYGCTCPDARALRNKTASRNKTLRLLGRPQIIPAIGSQRRVRALMALGWRARDIAQRIGWLSGEIDPLFRRTTMQRETADRIRAVYNDLANRPGPSEQTRRRARRAGYLPPLWWDDETIDDPTFEHPPWLLRADRPPSPATSTTTSSTRSHTISTACAHDVDPVVIERLLDGQPPLHVTRAERAEAVRLLNQRGKTRSEIAVQLHMSGGRVAQILDRFVRPATHTPTTDNDRQEASA